MKNISLNVLSDFRTTFCQVVETMLGRGWK